MSVCAKHGSLSRSANVSRLLFIAERQMESVRGLEGDVFLNCCFRSLHTFLKVFNAVHRIPEVGSSLEPW
ncbi:Myosin-binding protein 3, partial [Clarias magur]